LFDSGWKGKVNEREKIDIEVKEARRKKILM
jgi:hypothetical protein